MDMSGKKTVNIRYPLGFERIIKSAVLQFRENGLEPVIYRASFAIGSRTSMYKVGFHGASANKQFEYDHRNDLALIFDKGYADRLEAPLSTIAHNAGLEGAVIINKVRESEVGTGFNILKEEYTDMVAAGIVDPAKVTRSALQNATSVASTLLTTESVVSTIKEDAPAAMPAGGAPMGMM